MSQKKNDKPNTYIFLLPWKYSFGPILLYVHWLLFCCSPVFASGRLLPGFSPSFSPACLPFLVCTPLLLPYCLFCCSSRLLLLLDFSVASLYICRTSEIFGKFLLLSAFPLLILCSSQFTLLRACLFLLIFVYCDSQYCRHYSRSLFLLLLFPEQANELSPFPPA